MGAQIILPWQRKLRFKDITITLEATEILLNGRANEWGPYFLTRNFLTLNVFNRKVFPKNQIFVLKKYRDKNANSV